MPTTLPSRRRTGPLIVVLAVLVGACGAEGPAPATSAPASTAPSSASPIGSPSPGTPSVPTPSPRASRPPADRPDLAAVDVAVEVVVSGFDSPLFATSAGDGSGRLYVVEQGGRIRIVRDGRVEPAPFLDITDRVLSGGERGLLGLAFPPGFGPGRPVFYVHYSDALGDTTVSEFRLSDSDSGVADPSSERILLNVPQPYSNHNGGWIGFDADGMLLIALGDGGSAGDPKNRASDLESLLGKVLRIDVLAGPVGDRPYAIPTDNPFAGREAGREILHSGLRNPFRDSVDPATGDLWIGDVGQNAWEEIDVARAGTRGLDFGWRRWEGRHCFNPSTGCDPAGVTPPVAEYSHDLGCSVIGGVVYHGSAIPALRGGYLFSDYCSGTLWALDAGLDDPQTAITLLETRRSISAIGTADDGEVYLTDLGAGELLRLVPSG
jgi:glucose/arabinose dehydrogenase